MIRRKSVQKFEVSEDPGDGLQIGRMDGSVCEEDECWNDYRWKLIETNKRTFWYRSLTFFLAFHNYDPYAIFKCSNPEDRTTRPHRWLGRIAPQSQGTSSNSIMRSISTKSCDRYMMNYAEILRLPITEADHKRHKCTRILRWFTLYFFIKTLIISASQHALLKYELLVPRGHQPPWMSIDEILLVARYLGNPLHVLKDIAMLLYICPVALCVVSFVLIPFYYEHCPMNMAMLRFILNPAHELKRVDLNIRRKLDDIRMSLGVSRGETEKMLLDIFSDTNRAYEQRRRLLSPISLADAKKLLELENSWCAQLRSYLDHFNRHLYRLRPRLFSAKYFQESSAKMSGTIAGAHCVYIFCSTVMIASTEVPPYKDRCAMYRRELATKNRTATFCNPLDIYTPVELMVLSELALILIFCYVISGLNLALFSLVSANQTDLIKSIRNQLLRCLGLTIHRTNPRVLADESSANNEGAALERRLELDKSRLEALVRLIVCENELRDNAHSMSELTVHAFYYAAATTLFLVIVSGQFQISESQAIRRFIMIATWINVNAIAISCAHIFAKVIKLERVMWSILAAQAADLLHYDQSNRSFSLKTDARVSKRQRASPKSCTFVTNLWVKFVLATTLNIERYCARPLNIELTYDMIIELNFFVVFIYSLSADLGDRR